MRSVPSPMACEPEAQAPETVRFMPLSLKRQERFMVTVEFMDWKMAPDPTRVVSFFSLMMSTLLKTKDIFLFRVFFRVNLMQILSFYIHKGCGHLHDRFCPCLFLL